MNFFGKTAIFPGGYDRIGDIPHGRILPSKTGVPTVRCDRFRLEKVTIAQEICIDRQIYIYIWSYI